MKRFLIVFFLVFFQFLNGNSEDILRKYLEQEKKKNNFIHEYQNYINELNFFYGTKCNKNAKLNLFIHNGKTYFNFLEKTNDSICDNKIKKFILNENGKYHDFLKDVKDYNANFIVRFK